MFSVQGSVFSVSVQCSGFSVQGSGFRISGIFVPRCGRAGDSKVQGPGSRFSSLRLTSRVQGSDFRL